MSLSITDLFKNSGNKTKREPSPCEQKKGDCLKVIEYILDGEASPEEQRHFEEHILECISCCDQFYLDKTIKTALKTKINQIEVPADLIEAIKFKIDQRS